MSGSSAVYPSLQVALPSRKLLDSGTWTTLTFPTNTLIASQTWLPRSAPELSAQG